MRLAEYFLAVSPPSCETDILEATQRPLDVGHAENIVKYFRSGATFTDALKVYVMDKGSKLEGKDFATGGATLTLASPLKSADGQHRLEAVKHYFESYAPHFDDPDSEEAKALYPSVEAVADLLNTGVTVDIFFQPTPAAASAIFALQQKAKRISSIVVAAMLQDNPTVFVLQQVRDNAEGIMGKDNPLCQRHLWYDDRNRTNGAFSRVPFSSAHAIKAYQKCLGQATLTMLPDPDIQAALKPVIGKHMFKLFSQLPVVVRFLADVQAGLEHGSAEANKVVKNYTDTCLCVGTNFNGFIKLWGVLIGQAVKTWVNQVRQSPLEPVGKGADAVNNAYAQSLESYFEEIAPKLLSVDTLWSRVYEKAVANDMMLSVSFFTEKRTGEKISIEKVTQDTRILNAGRNLAARLGLATEHVTQAYNASFESTTSGDSPETETEMFAGLDDALDLEALDGAVVVGADAAIL
jgi:hypothetical protein